MTELDVMFCKQLRVAHSNSKTHNYEASRRNEIRKSVLFATMQLFARTLSQKFTDAAQQAQIPRITAMVRLTASKARWGRSSLSPVAGETVGRTTFTESYQASAVPPQTKHAMDEVNSIAAWQMGVWMSKHGKVTLWLNLYCVQTVSNSCFELDLHTLYDQKCRS